MSNVKKKKDFLKAFKEKCGDDLIIMTQLFLLTVAIILFVLLCYGIGRFMVYNQIFDSYDDFDINDVVGVFLLGLAGFFIISPLIILTTLIFMLIYGMINKIIAVNKYCYIPLTEEDINNINNNSKNKNKINNINDYIKYINKATHYFLLGHDYIKLNGYEYFNFLELSYKLWQNEFFDKKINLIDTFSYDGAFPNSSIYLSSKIKPWISEKYGLIFVSDLDDLPYVIYNQGTSQIWNKTKLKDIYNDYNAENLNELIDKLSVDEIRKIIEDCIY